LSDGIKVVIKPERNPISDLPIMVYGNLPGRAETLFLSE
jgi:hypothetical protein